MYIHMYVCVDGPVFGLNLKGLEGAAGPGWARCDRIEANIEFGGIGKMRLSRRLGVGLVCFTLVGFQAFGDVRRR